MYSDTMQGFFVIAVEQITRPEQKLIGFCLLVDSGCLCRYWLQAYFLAVSAHCSPR